MKILTAFLLIALVGCQSLKNPYHSKSKYAPKVYMVKNKKR